MNTPPPDTLDTSSAMEHQAQPPIQAPIPRPAAHAKRFRRLAAKPLKPLKLAASAINSVRSNANTPTPTPPSASSFPLSTADDEAAHSDSPARSGTASTTSSRLEPPSEAKERKRRSLPLRKKHTDPSVNSLDPVQVAHAARGPSKPLDSELPAAVLRVRVCSAEGLVAKDRNGFSDPFVTINIPPANRQTTAVVKRSLNPIFQESTSTFDFPIYLSLAGVIGGRGIEGVVWDKDLMRKEYMGEFVVNLDQWFCGGPVNLWSDNLPMQAHELISSRRRQRVSGSVSLQIGFLPIPGLQPAESLIRVTKVYDSILQRSYVGGHFGVLGVPAQQSIGTVMMRHDSDLQPPAGVQVITSAMMEPLTGETDPGKNHLVLADFELDDDGLSSSDDDDHMEDALEGDEDGYLRESPMPMDVNPLDAAGALVGAGAVPPPRKTSTGRSRGSSTASLPPTPGAPGSQPSIPSNKRRIFRRRKGKKEFNYNQDTNGVLGIVVMEIKSANDLPKLKNALRVGWDMDPFVVISFGKKVFRTRVIRHSLNPEWNEKLVFHVHEHESAFTVQMAVLDWDKISGNDTVGSAVLPLSELVADAPKPDPETGLYDENEDGKHESKEFTIPILTAKDKAWEAKHSPTITVRAKYEPYDALRQRFWRQYAMQYDSDDTGTISYVELMFLLDSLGSTLTRMTVDSFFTRFGKSADKDELSFDEVVHCLEHEIGKPHDQKRKVTGPNADVDPGELNYRLLGDLHLDSKLHSTGTSAAPSIKAPSTASSNTAVSTPPGAVPKLTVDDQSSAARTERESPMTSDVEDNSEHGSGDDRERVINVKECPLCHRPRMNNRSEQDIITHLATCASSDWSRVDRIMAATYVTSNQAQRKLISKIVNKVAIGSYSLGANSANTIVQNRITGQLEEEKMAVYVRVGIRVLYKGAKGSMASARAKKLLKSLSIKQGVKFDSPSSAADIAPFIAFHRLDVAEILDPLDSFKTFNEFFYRKLKDAARPLDDPSDAGRVVSMADCRLMCFDTVKEATSIWIKGRDFTVSRLFGPNYADIAANYDSGALAIFRLAPQDYHRFHSPVAGRIGKITKISGEYYTVNPQAIRSALDVYGENVRQVVPIHSAEFGTVMTVWVGAMMVGSILSEVKEGDEVQRGSPLGYFAFGGSTIVCVFEKGRVVWDQDLRDNAAAAIETLVRVKTGIGRAE